MCFCEFFYSATIFFILQKTKISQFHFFYQYRAALTQILHIVWPVKPARYRVFPANI